MQQWYPLTDALISVSDRPLAVPADCFSEIQRFVVLLYSRSSPLSLVNERHQELFCQSTRQITNIPPTEDSLMQHTKRAILQAGHCWAETLKPVQYLPNPSDQGWLYIGRKWQPNWLTLNESAKSYYEHCGCSKGC